METDRAPLEKYVRELEAKVTSLTENLKKEIMTRETDVKELSSQLAERTQNISEFKAKLEDQEAENQSLKHKYSITIRVCNLLSIILNLKTVFYISFNIDFKICYGESICMQIFCVCIHMKK